jgi:hypothetical protein
MNMDQLTGESAGGACAPGAATCGELGVPDACLDLANAVCANVQTCGRSTLHPDYMNFDYCIKTECSDEYDQMFTAGDCRFYEDVFLSGTAGCL